jgi:hypothetical protein
VRADGLPLHGPPRILGGPCPLPPRPAMKSSCCRTGPATQRRSMRSTPGTRVASTVICCVSVASPALPRNCSRTCG